MIVDSALYRDGNRVAVDCTKEDLTEIRDEATGANDFVWVGIHQPDEDELNWVAEVFSLHPLAVEDALNAHQRPKLERYEDNLFLVLKTLWYVDEEDAVETGEINLFVGRNFVVSVRHGKGGELHSARLDLEKQAHVLGHGPSAVVYAICDTVVDSYEAVGLSLEEDVDEVETSVFSPERTQDSQRIYILKRELAEVRRAVNPLREPMKRFATGSVAFVSQESSPFFRDVLDHLNRAAEDLDALEMLLSSAFDAHLARIQVQQNNDMRKISAGAAIIVVPTLVAGIYGMNFTHMPELGWRFGYAYALILMAGAVIGLWWWFRRSGWL